jgi:glycosyltransferase involved in cell wall biosynthesis
VRVLFVIAHLDKGGGQAVQCQQLYERLKPRLDSSELLALSARDPPTHGPQPDGSNVIGTLRFPAGLRELRRAIRARSKDYDIVHALDIYYALPAARLARARPLVVRLGSDPVEDLASRWGVWGRTWMRLVTPWMFDGTETVVNAPHLVSTVPTGHARFIPNGVDIERFSGQPSREEARRQLALPPDVPIVTFTGKVLPRKNLEDIFWLLGERPNLHFLLVGALSEPYYGDRYFRHLASDFPAVLPRVHAVGEVPIARLPLYLAATDLFVFPSRLEGMPNSVLEAMAAGLPVVASENPSHGDLVVGGGGQVYGDRQTLRMAVDGFLADASGRESAGRKARDFVRAHFSFESAVRSYIALYSEMLRS